MHGVTMKNENSVHWFSWPKWWWHYTGRRSVWVWVYIPQHGAVSTKFGSVYYFEFFLKFICQISFSVQKLLWLYADCWEALPGFGTVTHRKVFGASMEILTGCRRKLHSGNILTEFRLDKW